jgi:hypothetical protein
MQCGDTSSDECVRVDAGAMGDVHFHVVSATPQAILLIFCDGMHDADRIDVACSTYPVHLPGLCTLHTAMELSTAEVKGLQSRLS